MTVKLPKQFNKFTGLAVADITNAYDSVVSTPALPNAKAEFQEVLIKVNPNRFVQYSDTFKPGVPMGSRTVVGTIQQALAAADQADLALQAGYRKTQDKAALFEKRRVLFNEMVSTRTQTRDRQTLGDTAMEDATFITKFAKKVYIIHRKDTLRASKPMQDRAFKNPKIEFLWDSTVTEIHSNESGVNGITVENLKTGVKQNRETDGLFYAIGHQPNTGFLKGQITLDEHNFIQTHNGPETNIPGVFACGDVQDSYYRQAITAAGSGCQAAIKAERFLEGH